MIESLAALLIIVFALIPGILGNRIYELIGGSKKEGKLWDRIVRIISFSLLGFVIYVLVFVPYFNFPIPLYRVPETISTPYYDQTQMIQTVYLLIWMFILSALSALVIAVVVVTYNKYSPLTTKNAYDEFIRGYIQSHMVIVNLKSGASYSGIIERGDTVVKIDESDIVLKEPTLYSKENKNYLTSSSKYQYFPGNSISSIAVVFHPNIDGEKIIPDNRPVISSEHKPGVDTIY